MERTPLSKPLVIVVIGLPGSGKSFFATQFAASLEAPLVSEDKTRWLLFAHHTYDENENVVVRQVVNMLMTELFKTKKTFVLDGGYGDRASRSALATQAKKVGYNILTIVVQTDPPTARRRSANRNAKNSGDLYKQPLSGELFDKQAQRYQAPLHIDKSAVVISGKHTYSTQARMVLKKILEIQGVARTEPPEQPPAPIVRPRGPFIQ